MKLYQNILQSGWQDIDLIIKLGFNKNYFIIKINTEFIIIIEAKIIDPENLEIFLKIWNSRVNSPSKYEQFINGDNLRIIEIYFSIIKIY